jgi:beta-lactamase class A
MTTFAQQRNDTLTNRIKELFAGQQGVFAMAFQDVQTGETLLINEHQVFHAASTMKMPVMIELFRQEEQKVFSLRDSITIKNVFRSIVDSSEYSLDSTDDSQHDLYRRIGERESLYALLYQMIIKSSNLATNLLIEVVGPANVMRTMRELGAKDIQILRGVEDNKAYEKGLNNTTTAYDLMLLYNLMAKDQIVNKKACEGMIRILLDQQFNEIIPARLPAGVRVAHKTGSITGLRHDSGIVFLPDGRKYVLVLLSKDLKDVPTSIEMMAEVSERVYGYMVGKK